MTADIEGIKGVKYAFSEKVVLTKSWERYEIDLQSADLSEITHGFAFEVLKGNGNEKQVAYLDSIIYTDK